ncbi:acetylornithine aminotransferase [Candidatus Marinamargulisbacteria bacterium SCGC AG-410-N11]|nr:acetylornithine aminotransferase [Candidatus Marinamargulisbacteria bacterium SCGC AG-410-N11]
MSDLLAKTFFNDLRLKKAKQLLLDALQEHSSKIVCVKPSSSRLKTSYKKLLDQFAKKRGAPLWYPYLSTGLGNGALIELADGSIKYDFISGIGVHWSHSKPSLISASIDGALQDVIMQGNLQQNVRSLELSQLLTKISGMDHVVVSTSGAMAAENALKIALQKNHPKQRILAFSNCFIGRTITLANITDKAANRVGLPSVIDVDYIPFYDHNKPETSLKHSLCVLKKYLERYPNQHSVMCMELIQGEGGYYKAPKEFFISLMEELKKHNIIIMIDEIQTFGRSGSYFAYQEFGLQDYVDIVTIGKLSQVCATLFKKEINPKPGLISQTFTSSSAAIETSIKIINELKDDSYLGKNGKIHEYHHIFKTLLEGLAIEYPHLVEGPYGYGGMIAFTPFKGDKDKVLIFLKELFINGVIGFIAGRNPVRARFLLPLGGITKEDIYKGFEIIKKTLINTSK